MLLSTRCTKNNYFYLKYIFIYNQSMNSLEREIKIEKLNKHVKRQNYLKILSITCLGLDFFTFIIFESIELGFTNLENHTDFLIFYIVKVMYLLFSYVYLCFLGFFFYSH
jgi:hypothetical protein